MNKLIGALTVLLCLGDARIGRDLDFRIAVRIGDRGRSSGPAGSQDRKCARSRPPTVAATGLSINFAGTSSRTQILNFQASSITTFTYIVTPTKEGNFEIPAIEVSAGGKVYRTSSLTLKVVHENSNSAGQPTEFG